MKEQNRPEISPPRSRKVSPNGGPSTSSTPYVSLPQAGQNHYPPRALKVPTREGDTSSEEQLIVERCSNSISLSHLIEHGMSRLMKDLNCHSFPVRWLHEDSTLIAVPSRARKVFPIGGPTTISKTHSSPFPDPIELFFLPARTRNVSPNAGPSSVLIKVSDPHGCASTRLQHPPVPKKVPSVL